MKRLLILLLMLVFITPVFAADLTRDAPSVVEPGSDVEVVLTLTGLNPGDTMALEEAISAPLKLTKWEVEGSKEDRSAIKTRVKDNAWAWEFSPDKGTVVIKYTLSTPTTASGDHSLTAVWFNKDGFNKDEHNVRVGSEEAAPAVAAPPKKEVKAPAAPVNKKPLPIGLIVAAVVVLVLIGGWIWYSSQQRLPKKKKRK